MRVLVTGGAGFIGSHVVDELLRCGHEVAVLDNLSSGTVDHLDERVCFFEVDLGNRTLVEETVAKAMPEAILHLAAQKSVALSVEDPLLDARENILASLNLFDAARNHGVGKIVFASTGGALYGDSAPIPTPEDHPTFPESPYGIAKLAVEHYLRFYHKVHGIEVATLRMANVYGPRQDPQGEAGVVAIFCSKALARQGVNIFGDGLQTRDYTYVGDVARAFALALNAPGPLTVNIGTATQTSVVELADAIQLIVGHPLPRNFLPGRPGEIRDSCLSFLAAKAALGWKPEVGLHEGLAHTVRYFRSAL